MSAVCYSAAEAPAEAIVAHFDSLEREIWDIAESSEARSSSLKTTGAYFSELMREYPEFHDILRINSRGKVTNEIARDGKEGRRYRSVATQGWWRDVRRKVEPYYGNVRTRRGEYLLFWAVPMIVKDDDGDRHVAGALAVKLELDKCVKAAADRIGAAYMVTFDDRPIYRHKWGNADDPESSGFDINGMSGLAIHYDGSAVVADKETEPSSEPSAAAAAPTKEGADDAVAPKGKKKSIVLVLLPILIVIAIALIVFLGYQIKVLLHQRHERLMRQIEARDEEENLRRRPTARIPHPKSSGGASPEGGFMGFEGDVTQRIPMPEGVLGAPAQVTQPPPPPGAPSGQTTAAPSALSAGAPPGAPPSPSQPPDPTSPGASSGPAAYSPQAASPAQQPAEAPSSGPSPGEYEQIRQQVLQEIMPEVRKRMVKELDARQAEMAKNADAFGSEVTMLLHDLIGRISEMGDNATGIQDAVASTIRDLNGVVSRYRSRYT